MTQHRAKNEGHMPGAEWSCRCDAARERAATRRRPGLLDWAVLGIFAAALPISLSGQALPAASADAVSTGFKLPTTAGSMSYSVSGNESFSSGFYSNTGWQSATGVTGNFAMITSSRSYPFSMIVSGGHSFSSSSAPSTNYVDLAVSQVVNTHRWGIVLSDSVAYLPATPSVGLSGIAGTGDVGLAPVQVGSDIGLGILTAYSNRVSNAASITIQRRITPRISAAVDGSYSTVRFLGTGPSDNTGLNSDGYTTGGSLSYMLDARSTLSGNYAYARNTYSGSLGGFTSQTVSVGYSHQFSRRLSMDAFIGPQWSTVDPQTVSLYYGTVAPGTSINLSLSTSLNYSSRFANYSLGYSRGTNNGFGVLPGGRSDSVRFSASKTFDRVWSASTSAAFTRTTAVNSTVQSFAPKSFTAAAQVSRALAHSLSVYGSYTLEKQSTTGNTFGVFDLFTGSFQVVAFGLTYSPPGLHFGPR